MTVGTGVRRAVGGMPAAATFLLLLLLIPLSLAGCAPATPMPPGPTRADVKSALATVMAGDPAAYRRWGIDLVRIISPREYTRVWTPCIRNAGVTGVKVSSNGISWHTPPAAEAEARDAEVSLAITKCELQYPTTKYISWVHSPAQWSYLYDYLAGSFTACLRAAGQPAPVLGTRSGFVSMNQSGELSNPWAHVKLNRSSAAWKNLVKRCPARAPGLVGATWFAQDPLAPLS